MRVSPALLTVFPLTLAGVLATERLALLTLGASPDDAAVWNFWLHVHAACGRFWWVVESSIGGSVAQHLLMLALMVAVLVMMSGSRGWRSYSFICNHIALIITVGLFVIESQSRTSSLSSFLPSGGGWIPTWAIQLSAAHVIFFVFGFASCVLCHIVFLKNATTRHTLLSCQIRMLRQNL